MPSVENYIPKEWETPPCPFCGSAEYSVYERFGSAMQFTYVLCSHCGLVYLSPRPKYDQDFIVITASKSKEALYWVSSILKNERQIIIESKPLETASLLVEGIKWIYVFYESGLSINVLYTLNDPKKRAVGFKLSEGMEIPVELEKFKFARQKSKLTGTIRGSYFVIKNEY